MHDPETTKTSNGEKQRPLVLHFLFENSLFLIGGAVAALIWMNTSPDSYQALLHFSPLHETDGVHITLHMLVNDVLMAIFFAMAAKEVWESMLPGGALSSRRLAAMPLMATLGGVITPALVYLLFAWLSGDLESLRRGWAIPCATDIAFSYLIARLIFGNGHPAIAFLLLLAIADDALGLAILAVAYPKDVIQPVWFLQIVAAVGVGLGFRKLGLRSFWWYLLVPGTMSWFAFHRAGIHPALALVPIIPTMPHAATDPGLFTSAEQHQTDTLSEFEYWWKNPTELILGLFGLINAGVVFSSVGSGTWCVLAGLMIGKPLGISLFSYTAEKAFGLRLPYGMNHIDLFIVGLIAGIGFTVALFVAGTAYPESGPLQESVKMGALGSFAAAILALAANRILRSGATGNDSDTGDAA